MNSKMKQLLDKFLEGTTTLDEEKQLGRMLAESDVPAELKALAELLKAERCDASDVEEWLAEDLTDEFDRIVSRRKQHTVIRRLIAAASVLLIVGVGALLSEGVVFRSEGVKECRSEDNTFRNYSSSLSNTSRAKGIVSLNNSGESAYLPATEVIDESTEVLSGRNDVKPQHKAEIENKTKPDTTPSSTISEEQLNTLLAAHQAKLHEIDDSVDMAHIKDYIENDEQLYKIGQKALCLTCED